RRAGRSLPVGHGGRDPDRPDRAARREGRGRVLGSAGRARERPRSGDSRPGGRGHQSPAAPRRLRACGRRGTLRTDRPRARRAWVQGHDAHRGLRPRRLGRDLPGQSRRARGAPAEGVTEIPGCLEAEDCLRTLAAVGALGADVTRKGPGHYRVAGAGRHGLHESDDVIDCGNSGTTARLLLGVLAGQPFCTLLTGDASLRRRPMARVTEPLGRMGATIVGRAQATRLPLAVQGARPLRAIAHTSPVASAQVKSAVLLAGLYADGPVSVHEPAPSRDHSERMLRRFGARLRAEGTAVRLEPGDLYGTTVHVPGDISSAAFLLVAAAIVRDAEVSVTRVGVNPTRTGILTVLEAMGARVEVAQTEEDIEPAANLTLGAAELR